MNAKTKRSEILKNLKEVAGASGTISRNKYRASSKRRFSSWLVETTFNGFTRARRAAGLKATV